MNEEEKKAIEFLKLAKELKIVLSCSFWDNGKFEFNKIQKQQFDIVLNLIEKQQKEIEELKENQTTYKEFKEELKPLIKNEFIHKDKIREILKHYEYVPVDDTDAIIAFYSDIKKLLKEN